MRKPGCIEPVFYFVSGGLDLTNPPRPAGYLLISPYSDCPAPEGYRKEYAETLAQVDQLEKVLVQQEHDEWEREAHAEELQFEPRRQAVRDRLYARMTSAATDDWEKEFIRLYLLLRDERKREKYRQRFLERSAFLWARHNDTPKGRRVDEEKVLLDRLNG